MDEPQRVSLLQSIPFFHGLGSGELVEVARLLVDQDYPANHTVIREGQAGDSCFVIAQGKVAIFKEAGDGEEVLLAVRREGDFFGEMALLESTTRSATVRTLQASHLLELPAGAFQHLLRQNAAISWAVARDLSQRLRDTDSKLIAALDELHHHIRQRDQVLLPALGERTRQLTEAQEHLIKEHTRLREAYLDATRALVTLLEARHPYDQGHAQRVAEYACQIASQMGWREEDIEPLEVAALVHDIGRLGVPDVILDKKGQLTASEWTVLQRHPQYGASILRYFDYAREALVIIENHCEHWDGEGYPRGLRGEEIPLGGRILAVAEAYDAMLCERPHRRARTPAQAIEILRANAGRQWDPAVVRTFLAILEPTL